jgi:hypothetical protein
MLLIATFVVVVLGLGLRALLADGDELQTTAPTTTTTTTTTTTPAAEDAAGRSSGEPGDATTESAPSFSERLETITVVIPEEFAGDDTPAETVPAAPAPEPVRIPRPSCASGLEATSEQTAPFTGLTASIPTGLPAVVVKVSNNSSASRRALIGLDQADIVYEERIEASATRWAAVFHSSLPENVGPVRSGRTTDIQLIRNLGTPVFGYSGSNQGVAAQINEARTNGWLVPYINTDRAPFARDSRWSAPDNLFVDPASLGACGNGGTPSAVFAHGVASSTTAAPASTVSLDARSPYRFDWDAGSGTWLRSQDGTPHVTRSGAVLAPENVVVLFVPYVASAIDAASVDAQTVGSGNAWVFRDGTVTVGSWSRPGPNAGWTLTDAAGVATTLAPGQTWVVLAPAGSASWS